MPRRRPVTKSCTLLIQTKRFERRPQFSNEQLRLFPRREVTAFVELIEVDEFGIRPLGPTPRGGIDLDRKDAHSDRDRDVFGVEKSQLVLPIETCRRNRRAESPSCIPRLSSTCAVTGDTPAAAASVRASAWGGLISHSLGTPVSFEPLRSKRLFYPKAPDGSTFWIRGAAASCSRPPR